MQILNKKENQVIKAKETDSIFPIIFPRLTDGKKFLIFRFLKSFQVFFLELLCRFVGFESWIGDEELVSVVGWSCNFDVIYCNFLIREKIYFEKKKLTKKIF